MKKLLSTKDLRVLTILETLNEENISFEEMLKRLNITSKTLRLDIECINIDFNPIQIKESVDKFLYLSIPISHSFSWIYPICLKMSNEFQFLEVLFLEEGIDFFTLMERLFISESSLRRLIQRINYLLTDENIHIETNPLKISGNETSIRNFFIHYFMEKCPDGLYSFGKDKWNSVSKLLDQYLSTNYPNITYTDLEKIRILLIVSLIRESYGNKQNASAHSSKELVLNIEESVKEEIFHSFNIHLTKDYIINLFPHFFSSNFSLNEQEFFINAEINEEVRLVKLLFENMINEISKEIDLPIPNLNKLLMDLCNAFFLDYGKPYILYDLHGKFVKHLKKLNPKWVSIFEKKLIAILEQTKNDTFHLNNYLYIIITHWKKLYEYLRDKDKITEIGIFFNTDLEHTKFIKNMLETEYSQRVSFEIIESREIENIFEQFQKYDYVITNIPSSNFSNVICFSNFPTKNDLEILHKKLVESIRQKLPEESIFWQEN